jgi:CDP-paratose 2-epimerase
LFGASKTAADVVAQEYGRYFGMNVGVFRGGCLTGEHHSGVQLHGFLSYLVKVAVRQEPYAIFGYKGKQVRDQIHSSDVITALLEFARRPRPGEVYNLGGGRANSASVLECIERINARLGRKMKWTLGEEARLGDHICYISDLRKFQSHYPGWKITVSLDEILDRIVRAHLSEAGA